MTATTKPKTVFTALFLISLWSGSRMVQAQSQNLPLTVRMRSLTPKERQTAARLPMPGPPHSVAWAVAVIAKEVPINFPGLPTTMAFEQTTLVFAPGPSINPPPTTVTAIFMWPERTIDPATGSYLKPIRIEGVLHTTPVGSQMWLFNIESILEPFRRGTLQLHFEIGPGAMQMKLEPDTFTSGKAWAYFDQRLGAGSIVIGPAREDGTHGMMDP